MALPMSTAHIHPGGHSLGLWNFSCSLPIAYSMAMPAVSRKRPTAAGIRVFSHKLCEPLSTLGQHSPLDLESFHEPAEKGIHVFTQQMWEHQPWAGWPSHVNAGAGRSVLWCFVPFPLPGLTANTPAPPCFTFSDPPAHLLSLLDLISPPA